LEQTIKLSKGVFEDVLFKEGDSANREVYPELVEVLEAVQAKASPKARSFSVTLTPELLHDLRSSLTFHIGYYEETVQYSGGPHYMNREERQALGLLRAYRNAIKLVEQTAANLCKKNGHDWLRTNPDAGAPLPAQYRCLTCGARKAEAPHG